MKIDSVNNRPGFSGVARPTVRPAGENTKSPAVSGDAVELSSASSSLSAGNTPSVNAARVQEIRQALSEGRFQINPSAIADRLISSARELTQNNRVA